MGPLLLLLLPPLVPPLRLGLTMLEAFLAGLDSVADRALTSWLEKAMVSLCGSAASPLLLVLLLLRDGGASSLGRRLGAGAALLLSDSAL